MWYVLINKYLGHMITNKISDNEDIKRQMLSFMAKLICYYARPVNARAMSNYSCSHLTIEVYACHLWCNYTVKQYRQSEVADKMFRRLVGYEKFCSASDIFVENPSDKFDSCVITALHSIVSSYSTNTIIFSRVITLILGYWNECEVNTEMIWG